MATPKRPGLLIPVIVAVVGLAAIAIAENEPTRHRIENSLTSRSAAALQAAGIDGRVTFTGRDGTVYLPTGVDSQRALDIVLSQEGVRDAHVVLPDGATPTPSVTLSITPTDSPTPTDTPSPTGSPSPTASPSASPSPTPAPTPSGPSSADVQKQIDALGTVEFTIGSAALTAPDQAILAKVAALLATNPAVRLRIQGNTDSMGSSASNMSLSMRRAESVRLYLVAHGVTADRLTVVGYGETRPAMPNTSDANRAVNRRVDLAVIG